MITMKIVFIVLLVCLFQTVQCRSIKDITHWLPDGDSSVDLLNDYGISVDAHSRYMDKIKEFRRLVKELTKRPPPSDSSDQTSEDTNILEGDIVLSEQQLDRKLERLKSDKRQKRNVVDFKKLPEKKWDMPIPYKFDGKFDSAQMQVVRDSMQHWMDHTCITFEEFSPEVNISKIHFVIKLLDIKKGCYAFVGKPDETGPNVLGMEAACLFKFGIPVHELGHIFGMWHEQSRTDRTDFIDILWENIIPGAESQFDIENDTDFLGVQYDYGSIMHYPPLDFGINGSIVLRAKQPLYQRNMGPVDGLAFSDIKKINLAYNCLDACKGVPAPSCLNDGYQDPKDCASCRCPDGFAGQFCQSLSLSKNAVCGGELVMNPGSELVVKSPGYDFPQYYEPYQECTWRIKALQSQNIQLRFVDEFAIYCLDAACQFHWVEVKYKAKLSEPGARFCCDDRPTAQITSVSSEMMIIFKSNFTWKYTPMRGFKVILTTPPICLVQNCNECVPGDPNKCADCGTGFGLNILKLCIRLGPIKIPI